MSQDLGAVTAVFTVYADAYTPIENDVRAVFTARGAEPDRVWARSIGGTAVLVVERSGSHEVEASKIVEEIRALAHVRSAELECRIGRTGAARAAA